MTIVGLMIAVMMQAAPVSPPERGNDVPVPGQRQTREDATPNIAPMSRLSTRIGSRIDARIQSRILQSQPDTTAAYKAAADQTRRTR